MAIRDPYYVLRAAAWTVLCNARIDWVVTGDVSCDMTAVAATKCGSCLMAFSRMPASGTAMGWVVIYPVCPTVK